MGNQQQRLFKLVPSKFDLAVSNDGVLIRPSNNKVLNPFTDKDGYLRYKIWDKKTKEYFSLFQHRAVALAWIPNPNNLPQVNHIDNVRDNNFECNLEWVTSKQNARHCVISGRTLKGEKSPVSKYTESTIRQICSLLEYGFGVTIIPKMLGVDRNLPFKIKARETWVDISCGYNIPYPKKHKIKE